VDPFARLAEAAAAETHRGALGDTLGYHLDARPENVMAIAAWGLGLVLLAAEGFRTPVVLAIARAGDRLGPRRWYSALRLGLNSMSDRAHRTEVRDLRTSLAAVLVPTGFLVAIGFAVTPNEGAYVVGSLTLQDVPIVVLLALA